MPETNVLETKFLQNLWEENQAACAQAKTAGAAAIPLQPAGCGPAHHQFRRRKYQLEVRSAGSSLRQARARPGGQRKRRGSALHHHLRFRDLLYMEKLDQLVGALSRAKRMKMRWWRIIRCAPSAKIEWPRPSTPRCTRSFPSIMWTICIRIGASRWQPAPTASDKLDEFNRRYGRKHGLAAVAAARLRTGDDVAPGRGRKSRLRRHHAGQPRPVHLGPTRNRNATPAASGPSTRWASLFTITPAVQLWRRCDCASGGRA